MVFGFSCQVSKDMSKGDFCYPQFKWVSHTDITMRQTDTVKLPTVIVLTEISLQWR